MVAILIVQYLKKLNVIYSNQMRFNCIACLPLKSWGEVIKKWWVWVPELG